MGVPRFGLGGGGDPRQTDGLLMVSFETAGLGGGALHLKRPGFGLSGRGRSLPLGLLQTAGGEAERVPVQTQPSPDD
jgi:hypothetical protein